MQHFRRTISRVTAPALVAIILCISAPPAGAQTFRVLHSFTGGSDGATPFGGLTLDRAGNIYGTASAGGYTGNNCTSAGCGTVFKLTNRNGAWILTPLYAFRGSDDGANPYAGVTIGANGTLYGTTLQGGTGAGTVFNLSPPARATGNITGGWTETVIYRFGLPPDGQLPAYGKLVFDSAGDLYGTTFEGGAPCYDAACGTVFKLTPLSGGGWTKTDYDFTGQSDGSNPLSGVVIDAAGNLYGTTSNANVAPVVYRLLPSASGWTETTLYTLEFFDDPRGGVILDGSGGLYGGTVSNLVYQLTPAAGQWNYTLLYTFTGFSGVWSPLIRDASGNLYGVTCGDGASSQGTAFKLTPTGSGWSETDLYEFTGHSDGGCPVGGAVLDANGNLYGTTAYGGAGCGSTGCGVLWEITP